MAYVVLRPEEQRFEAPSWRPDDPARTLVELPRLASLRHCRAHLWRYPPGASGHRHRETVQEEIFLVVEGTLSMELGESAERVDLPPRTIAVVEPGTAIRVFNDSQEDVLVFAVGAPAEQGTAEILEKMWGDGAA
jgi:mannose-6-phosphate isomerase-like protein (cupin superfamily)